MGKNDQQKFGRSAGFEPLSPETPREAKGLSHLPETVAAAEEPIYRLLDNLHFKEEIGIIVNDNSDKKDRQVVFRVETFNLLLDGIYDLLSEDYWDTADRLIHKCGYSCGQMFSNRMYGRWTKDNDRSLSELVDIWCEFDSRSGFGKLKQTVKLVADGAKTDDIIGEITFLENFQRRNNKKYPHNVCCFILGYCEGVLNGLVENSFLNFQLLLKCDQLTCLRCGGRGSSCRFFIVFRKHEDGSETREGG